MADLVTDMTLEQIPHSVAVLDDHEFVANGFDRIRKRDANNATTYAGMYAPTTAGVLAASGTGLTGAYNARWTYYNALTDRESNAAPAASAALTLANQGLQVTITKDSPADGQWTHWKLYRTVAGGSAYLYDQKIAIATTVIVSTTADASLGAALETTHEVPPGVPYIAPIRQRMWYWGGRVYNAGTVAVVNANATVTGTSTRWRRSLEGRRFQKDGDDRYYIVGLVNESAQTFVLQDPTGASTTYAGTGTSGSTYRIFGDANGAYYSEVASDGSPRPEYVNLTRTGRLVTSGSYIVVGGDDGDMGSGISEHSGRPILYKHKHIYVVSGDLPAQWRVDKVNSPVGAVAHNTIQRDDAGRHIFYASSEVQALPSGIQGVGEGIGVFDGANIQIVSVLTKSLFENINHERDQYAHAVWYQKKRQYWLFVASKTESTTQDMAIIWERDTGQVYVYSGFDAVCSAIVDGEIWIGTSSGFPVRLEVGNIDMVDLDSTNNGTATAGAATTMTDSTAAFTTAGSGLKGAYIVIRPGLSSEERKQISSNTATVITVTSAWDTNPASGDTYYIGGIQMYRFHRWDDFADSEGHGGQNQKVIDGVEIMHDETAATLNLGIDWYRDMSTTKVNASTVNVDLSTATTRHGRVMTPTRARTYRFKMSHQKPNEGFTVRGYKIFYRGGKSVL